MIVTCMHSGLSWIVLVESLNCVFCMVEVFCLVPDFVVFWWVTFPLSSILEHVIVELRVDDFVDFVFVFSVSLNRRGRFLDLRGEVVVLVRFQERDVKCVVYGN